MDSELKCPKLRLPTLFNQLCECIHVFPPGSDLSAHQTDHHENSLRVLSNGHSHRGQHGHRHGSKCDMQHAVLDCLLPQILCWLDVLSPVS